MVFPAAACAARRGRSVVCVICMFSVVYTWLGVLGGRTQIEIVGKIIIKGLGYVSLKSKRS